ncbi:pyrimidine 5'-nucleotidase [Phaeobacter sp. B1627]|uniref:pyrimidine 5'-nucleotidase n=1 Tax=Phaeobacter sp. B1627 TaxID=2583809 RepID=UPI00111B33D9|nr:pyrimidine 5'-nucleotidase [Phaeobacter sp. B1627]TNJ41969.1 pyrimidine 5'-nucleotidase [Phaeobacter sp. B1627]
MVKQSFSHVEHWVFDLDNTLYPPAARLFDQIEEKMITYMVQSLGLDRGAADQLRGDYWRNHGTTLAGLMADHDIDPDPFLVAVHDISLTHLEPDQALAAHIGALPGRKIVYTNGSAPYAERVLAARGLSGLFDGIFGVEHAGYRPKPERGAFERVFAQAEVDTARAAMFEDDPRNLNAPHEMGMRTVHVAPEPVAGDHIHHHTVDLTGFLGQLR